MSDAMWTCPICGGQINVTFGSGVISVQKGNIIINDVLWICEDCHKKISDATRMHLRDIILKDD